MSAHTGAHRSDKAALGRFLRLVEAGRIRRGSYLLIEDLDGLSREEVQDGLEPLLGLLRAGAVVVQLIPVPAEFAYPADPMKLVMGVVELSRGNSESRMKAERLGRHWRERRRKAAAGEMIVTKKLPGWVVFDAGRLALHPDRAGTLRLIYRLAREGCGVYSDARRPSDDKVPTWGRSPSWGESVVYSRLTSRAVLGEYQPTTGSGTGGKRLPAGTRSRATTRRRSPRPSSGPSRRPSSSGPGTAAGSGPTSTCSPGC